MKRDILNSPRLSELKNKRRKAIVNKIYIVLFCIVVSLGFLVYLSRISKLNIASVEVVGNSVVDTSKIQEEVNKETTGYYVWVFPKTNIFFYPRAKIETSLRENFKRLDNINISIKNTQILEIKVSEREPKYTWCGISVNSNDKCYFTDSTGYIFDSAPYFRGDVYFKFYGLVGGGEDPTGNYFSQQYFQKLLNFKDILDKMNLNPKAIYVGENDDVSVLLANTKDSNTKPEIRFKIDADITKVAENLGAALSVEPLATDFKKKYDSLLYVDLRFGNKVYYKFRP